MGPAPPDRPAELVDEPWITVPADDVGGRVVVDAFRARGLAEPRVAVTTYSIHLRHSLAADGRFIAALPASVLRFNAGNLRELPIDLPEPSWPVAIATPKRRSTNPIVARFIESARDIANTYFARSFEASVSLGQNSPGQNGRLGRFTQLADIARETWDGRVGP